MLSKWRLVSVNGDTNALGCYEIYSNACRLVVEDITTGIFETVSGQEIFKERIIGVAQLTEVSILAQCMSKLQAEIVNCFASIKGYKCKYTFDCYVDMSAEVCIRKSVIDIIADSYSKPDENVTLEGDRLEIIGRAIATYKFVFTIRNREKFDKLITKYCIMRDKK